MSHLDEGQLHALLDGELNQTERRSVEAHLEACAECRRDFAEAKALMAGADDLIASVQLPAGTGAAAVAPMPKTGGFRWRTVAWAASIVVAVGLGWLSRADYMVSPGGYSQKIGESVAAPALADSAQTEEKARLKANSEVRRDEAVQANGALNSAPAAPASPPPQPQPAKPELAKQKEPVATTDAVRALTNPADKDAEDARQSSGAASTDQVRRADKTESTERVAPAPEQPLAVAQNAPKESGFAGPAASAAALKRTREVAGFRPTPMEAAVRILGGSIRLVDGMTPTGVLVGPGTLVSGADPGLEIVRVVYDDPPGRELWLDQQRPRENRNELDAGGRGATTLLLGDTLVVTGTGAQRGLRWIHQSGFRLGLTGFLPADSLRALARKVQ